MSKPVVRVTFFVLISLVLIAATSVGARGWLSWGMHESAGARAQSHNVSGLQTNFNHDRSTVSELKNLQMQTQSGKGHQGGGCNSSAPTNPDDY